VAGEGKEVKWVAGQAWLMVQPMHLWVAAQTLHVEENLIEVNLHVSRLHSSRQMEEQRVVADGGR
jgi:hypothetical protein